jgi:hypothetical protein
LFFPPFLQLLWAVRICFYFDFSLLAGSGIVSVVIPFLSIDMSAMSAAKSYRTSLRRRLATIDYFKYDIKAVL